MTAPEVIAQGKFGGHEHEVEEEHEMEGNLAKAVITSATGQPREIFVGEHDVSTFEERTSATPFWLDEVAPALHGVASVLLLTSCLSPSSRTLFAKLLVLLRLCNSLQLACSVTICQSLRTQPITSYLWRPQVLGRFDRALAEVRTRTGATLTVFPVYAPSESRWYGMNFGKKYAGINLGFTRPEKAYKWTIVHELAHQQGSGHDLAFSREFQKLAVLMDPSD